MRLYTLLSRVFPKSFAAKVYAVAYLGALSPLLVGIVLELAGPGPHQTSRLAWTLILATALTTAGTLLALRALLKPLLLIAERLSTWDEVGHAGHLPDGYEDELGAVMQQANRLMDRASARVERSRVQAEVDPLTGALNRRGVTRWVGAGRPGWLLQIDIDGFKAVNDRWGHEKGDAILREIVRAARSELRPHDMLARFGGDEFVAVLADVDAKEAGAVAERIRHAVERDVRVGEQSLTISIGLVRFGAGGELTQALAKADEALYHAKRLGRNRVCWADGSVCSLTQPDRKRRMS
jgi:diguanylate cyclase (GGDEF)-like protein